jgi:hypothetical protein
MFEPNEFQMDEIKNCLSAGALSATDLWGKVTSFEERSTLLKTLREMVKHQHIVKENETYRVDPNLKPIPFDDYQLNKALVAEVIAPTPKVAETKATQQAEVFVEETLSHHPTNMLSHLLFGRPQPVVVTEAVHKHVLRNHEIFQAEIKQEVEPPKPKPVFKVPEPPKPVVIVRTFNPNRPPCNLKLKHAGKIRQVNECLSQKEDNILFGSIQINHHREAEVAYLLYQLRNAREISFRELILFTGCDRVRMGALLKRLVKNDYIQIVFDQLNAKRYRWKFYYCYPFPMRRPRDKKLLQFNTYCHIRKMQQDSSYNPFEERPSIDTKPSSLVMSRAPMGDLRRDHRLGQLAYFFYSNRTGMAFHSGDVISRLRITVVDAYSLLSKLVERRYIDIEVVDGLRYYGWSNRYAYPFHDFKSTDERFFGAQIQNKRLKNKPIDELEDEIQDLQSRLKALEAKKKQLQTA